MFFSILCLALSIRNPNGVRDAHTSGIDAPFY
jgi:hypothetical protein